MVDVEQVIYDKLNAAGSAFKTLVGSNIFVDRSESFDGSASKGIVFRVKGGKTDQDVPIQKPIVDFFCFGGTDTPEDAKSVYRALHDLMHHLQNDAGSTGYIMSSHEVVIGQTIIDPKTKLIQVFTSYQFQIRATL